MPSFSLATYFEELFEELFEENKPRSFRGNKPRFIYFIIRGFTQTPGLTPS